MSRFLSVPAFVPVFGAPVFGAQESAAYQRPKNVYNIKQRGIDLGRRTPRPFLENSTMLTKSTLIALIAFLAIFVVAAIPAGTPEKSIEKILMHPKLWGKDFPDAIARLQNWTQIGEKQVVVFPRFCVGATPLKMPEAEKNAAKLHAEMGKALPDFHPAFMPLLKKARDEKNTPFKVEPQAFFPDDDSVRIVWKAVGDAPPAEFLAPKLTMKQVHEEIGKPEEVTKELIFSVKRTGEKRPVALTKHVYAKGAIVFAESDWNPRPGSVDRVIFTVAPVVAMVLKETKK
jgi:hypothetical protein